MKFFKDRIVPERKEKLFTHSICDFCGNKSSGNQWNSSIFEVDETKIEVKIIHKNGQAYPEGGSGEEFFCDICPNCFKEKVFPFLKSISQQTLEYKEWDY